MRADLGTDWKECNMEIRECMPSVIEKRQPVL